MRRLACEPRPNFRDILDSEGMLWASETVDGHDVPYWTDSAYYSFSPAEIDRLEAATDELWGMCLSAATWMLTTYDDRRLCLPEGSTRRLLASLEEGDPGSHARFDLCLAGDGTPKML